MPTDYSWECLVTDCGAAGELDGDDAEAAGAAYDAHYAEAHDDLYPPQPAYSFVGPAIALEGPAA